MGEVFREWRDGRIEVGSRGGLKTTPGSMQAMPAHLLDQRVAGTKWFAHYPRHVARGCDTVSAVVILNDSSSGEVLAVLDARSLTAARTAAVTAMAIATCSTARETCVIVGTGRQAAAHVRALGTLPYVRQVTIVGRSQASAESLIEAVGPQRFRLAAGGQRQLADAAAQADVLVTTTNEYRDQLLAAVRPAPGQTFALVDNPGRETRLLERADFVVVDDPAHFRTSHVRERFGKHMPGSFTWLADVLCGSSKVPHDAVTLLLNLGVAPCDIALAEVVRQRALAESAFGA